MFVFLIGGFLSTYLHEPVTRVTVSFENQDRDGCHYKGPKCGPHAKLPGSLPLSCSWVDLEDQEDQVERRNQVEELEGNIISSMPCTKS
jgi:hypothetical protein